MITQTTQNDYAPYLRHLVEPAKHMSFEDFRRMICGCDEKWKDSRKNLWDEIAQDSELKWKVRRYQNAASNEASRYAPFVDLANAVWDHLGHKQFRFCRNNDSIVSGSHASRKPDLLVIDTTHFSGNLTVESCNANGPSAPFWWDQILGFNEFIYTGPATSASTSASPMQCANYALEIFAHGGIRDFVLGMYTKNAGIKLIYYDHSMVIVSHSVDIVHQIRDFICLLDAVAHMKWGRSEVITLSSRSSKRGPVRKPALDLFEGGTLSLPGDPPLLTLGKTLFYHHGIIGRGTFVIRATVSEACSESNLVERQGAPCVVKLSRPPKSRLSEPELIKTIREKASQRSQVLDSLPDVWFYTDLPSTAIQERLGEFYQDYELRAFRIAVVEELSPITTLTEPSEYEQVFKDIFKCYRWLVEQAQVLHRDLSEANIMVRRRDNARPYGVLNDFDLAIQIGLDQRGPSSQQRMGTAPYMAIDLLGSPTPAHLYRHDLESLYYVLVCAVCERKHPAIKKWFTLSGKALRDAKRSFFHEPPLRPRPEFEAFSQWLDPIHTAFQFGFSEEVNVQAKKRLGENVSFDDETLGGEVSFEVFSDAFEKRLY